VLASVLVLVLLIAGIAIFSLVRQTRLDAEHIDAAMRESLMQRQQVERARMEADEARRAAEKKTRRLP